MFLGYMACEGERADCMQAAGGIISASILSTPGASKIYKGGVTVCFS